MGDVEETLVALRGIEAAGHAVLLEDCWHKVKKEPVELVASLDEYSTLASERSFTLEDAAYYQLKPDAMSLLESNFGALLEKLVAIDS